MIEPRITDLAEKLGRAMAASERIRKFKQLHAEVREDKEAQELVKALREQESAIVRKEQAKQPIEVADKQKLSELQEKTYQNEKLKALMAAQADYVELIQQVNDLIGRHLLTPEEASGEEGPSQPPPAEAGKPET